MERSYTSGKRVVEHWLCGPCASELEIGNEWNECNSPLVCCGCDRPVEGGMWVPLIANPKCGGVDGVHIRIPEKCITLTGEAAKLAEAVGFMAVVAGD